MLVSIMTTRFLLSSGFGRSTILFKSLKTLQSIIDEKGISQKVAFMKCLITLIEEENFADAIRFIDYLRALNGNPILTKMKHLMIMTTNLDYNLLKNITTGNIDVHIISPYKKDGTNKLHYSIL